MDDQWVTWEGHVWRVWAQMHSDPKLVVLRRYVGQTSSAVQFEERITFIHNTEPLDPALAKLIDY